jgi:tetratricopeptide (TPR) repeat protein
MSSSETSKVEGRLDQPPGLQQLERTHLRSLQVNPYDIDARRALGAVCQAQGRLDEAVSHYEEVLRIRPEDIQTRRGLGDSLYLGGRFADAAAVYRQVVQMRPEDAETRNNLGAALADLGQLDDAVVCYHEALRLRPDFAHAHYNLGNALRLQGRLDEAVASYGRALQSRADFAEAHYNLGLALNSQGRYAEAITGHLQALRLRPGYAQAHNGLGLALANSGRLAEALASYEEALRLRPDFADAHRNRSLVWLLAGDLRRGWPEYEWRWECDDFTPPRFPQPAWDGAPLEGRSILLYAEQGLGDTLQFVRFASLVKERGGVVILAAPAVLHPILAGCPGLDQIVPLGTEWPAFDLHLPLMSLPKVLGTTLGTIPADVPYLRAEPARVASWGRELASIREFKVGIAWQGNPGIPYDRVRSFPLRELAALAEVEGVRLFSLQKGPGTEQLRDSDARFPIVDLASRLDEDSGAFMDTAAVLTHLDLVVTCDSVLAHLAGALGVPAWVALPIVPDWRWLLEREDTPWYPTLRLFRQTQAGGWTEPFRRMADELLRRIATAPGVRQITIGVTLGELVDRITILEIKDRRLTDPERLRNVRSELAELVAARDGAMKPADSDGVADLAVQLRAANEAIWEAEDELRRCEDKGDFGSRFIGHARSVYYHNDRRAALKRQINDRLGWRRNEEKLYTPYQMRGGPIE